MIFPDINRITINPNVMGGKPCIRGMRVTAGTITGLLASGVSFKEIIKLYPYLEEEDIKAALSYETKGKEKHINALPIIWAKDPDLTALFSIATETSKLDLNKIRESWKRKN